MNIRDELRKALLKEGSGGHEYGCVMLYLDIDKDWWKGILNKIEEEDVYNPKGERKYGKQPYDEVHVTILYGLHANVPDKDVEELIEKITGPEIILSEISTFNNDDKGFDVVKFDVESKELNNMNKMFRELPYTNDYPEYHPHITISYVKLGTGKKYARKLSDNESLTLKPNKVVYSKANGEKKEYDISE